MQISSLRIHGLLCVACLVVFLSLSFSLPVCVSGSCSVDKVDALDAELTLTLPLSLFEKRDEE